MFSFFETPATIERLTAYSSDKASLAAVAGTVFGALRPIDQDENTIALNLTGQGYRFDVDDGDDVRVNDRLTINSEVFVVRGIKKYNQRSIDAKACFLEKPQKSP